MAVEIIALRAYKRTFEVYEDHNRRGEPAEKLPITPLMQQVVRNDFELQKARKAKA